MTKREALCGADRTSRLYVQIFRQAVVNSSARAQVFWV